MVPVSTTVCILLLVSSCPWHDHAARAAHSGARVYRELDFAKTAKDVKASIRGSREDRLSDISCPDAAAILPCVCTVEEQVKLDLDCSEVESEDQLANIMASSFPFAHFRRLTIKENANLKVLKAGVLANITFQEFNIYWSVLEEVEAGALSGSYSTATQIILPGNKIMKFPWEELPLFTYLTTLELGYNLISTFPLLVSDSLLYLGLMSNPVGSVPEAAFSATPALESVMLAKAGLSHVAPGTLSGLTHLLEVDLYGNSLTALEEGTVQFSSSGPHYVSLQNNDISTVAVNALTGLTAGDGIFLASNKLTVLAEGTWRPLLQDGVQLFLIGNPLVCGCDIAWIMLNSTFLSLIAGDTMCADGQLLVNLDPTFYLENC